MVEALIPFFDETGLNSRVEELEKIVKVVQNNFVDNTAPTVSVSRVESALKCLPGSALFQVTKDYYTLKLRERAGILCSPVHALCKTLVFLNPHGTMLGNPTASLSQQRYLAVILQYSAKLNVGALEKALGVSGISLAEDGVEVTGFEHNGVTPFGSLTPLPIVVSRGVVDCGAQAIWLGGGEENVKARVFLAPLLRQSHVKILSITEPRPEEEWNF